MTASPTYAYLGRWNYSLHKPVPDESWITEDEARSGLEAGVIRCDIVPAEVYTRRDETPRPSSPWVITAFGGGATGFSVNFLTQHGSIRRIVDYDNVDGRLFMGSVIDYTYPDDARWYAQYDCTQLFYGILKPDGTGFLTINDKSRPTVERLSIDQIDVSGNWLDYPAFGDWHVLLDPDFGARPTPPHEEAPAPVPTKRPFVSSLRSSLRNRFRGERSSDTGS